MEKAKTGNEAMEETEAVDEAMKMENETAEAAKTEMLSLILSAEEKSYRDQGVTNMKCEYFVNSACSRNSNSKSELCEHSQEYVEETGEIVMMGETIEANSEIIEAAKIEMQSQVLSEEEKSYQNVRSMSCEDFISSKCSYNCNSQSEFYEHTEQHIEEIVDNASSKRHVENYTCAKCDRTFEVKSDLIIHYNTVCLDAFYMCKHCRENCENSPFLQMHLLVYHSYSEQNLKDEGFLTDMEENPIFEEASFVRSITPQAPRVTKEGLTADNKTLTKPSYFIRKSRTTNSNCRNLACNLLDKMYACELCNESFSRKCVLDIHAQKHFSEKAREVFTWDSSARSRIANFSRNNSIPTGNTVKKGVKHEAFEVKKYKSNDKKGTLLKSTLSLRSSSAWRKIKLKSRLRSANKYVVKRVIRRANLSKNKKNLSSNPKELSKIHISRTSKKKNKLGSFQNVTSSDKQKDSSDSNVVKKLKPAKTKRSKQILKNAKDFACTLCTGKFKDSYKLKRHFLIHTGERPFSCTKCKKTFVRDDHLKRHLVRVCGH